ncbi:MAG: ABC transporter ATP-binding protein [Deltaproteobacteria bacterium]|nr:ABC transporter ATP-binding protein [Deltaproteobacteria bacterium]
MIEAVGLTAHYGVRPILRDVSLHVATGELVAIMGPNGVGKTTLLKVLAGALPPRAGHVLVDGLPTRFLGGSRARDPQAHGVPLRRAVDWSPGHRAGLPARGGAAVGDRC